MTVRRPSWAPKDLHVDARRPEPFRSHEEAVSAWLETAKASMARNTATQAEHTVRLFLSLYPAIAIQDFRPQHVQRFADLLASKCKWFQDGTRPQCLRKVAPCPILEGRDARGCPHYTAVRKTTVGTYLGRIAMFFTWLIARDYYAYANPVAAVHKEYGRLGAAEKERLDEEEDVFVLTVDHVRSLVLETPIHRGTMYASMAKGYLRLHEAAKLRFHPDYFSLAEGWLTLPHDSTGLYGNKRRGTKRIRIDAEMQARFPDYLDWREEHIKRRTGGTPIHDRLFITQKGNPWPSGDALTRTFNPQLEADCLRLGITRAGEKTPTSHAFRRFATTWSADLGIADRHLKNLRGDRGDKTLWRYDKGHETRLERLYDQYGPKLGI